MKVRQNHIQLFIIALLLLITDCIAAHSVDNDSKQTAVVNRIIKFDIERLTGVGELDKIVIDAGHGGKDHGCSGAHSKEKFIVLDIAKKLGQLLRSYHPEIEIIYTRETDVFIPLDTRIQIANKNKADLFISIHANYISKAYVRGTETYVMGLHRAEDNLAVAKRENSSILYESDYQSTYGGYDPNSPEAHILLSMYQNAYLDKSINFATKIENSFSTRTPLKSRGVKQAGFLVLRKATMPSTLIETGFLSSSDDEAYLMSSNGQDEVADAILKAITEYKREINGEYWSQKSQPIAVAPPKTTSTTAPEEEPIPSYDRSTAVLTEATATHEPQATMLSPRPHSTSHSKTASGATGIPGTKVITHTTQSPTSKDNSRLNDSYISETSHPKTASGATGIPGSKVISQPRQTTISENESKTNGSYTSNTTSHPKTASGATGISGKEKAVLINNTPSITTTASTSVPIKNINSKVFRIQIAAGKNKLLIDKTKFTDIADLEIRKEENLYKYVVGYYDDLASAFDAKQQFIARGFKGAFVVAYENNERSTL